MTCFQPAPDFYVFVMHNLHFLSTPVYILATVALFREKSQLFRKYKYYLIVHLIANFLSEVYVTFLWLPMIHLPYEVYMTTGWLAQLNVSGIFQFMTLGLFINLIGVSILEMFYHRFQVVVIHRKGCSMKLPAIVLTIFRLLTVVHIIVFIWGSLDGRRLVYQQKKKDAMYKKEPELPAEILCYTVVVFVAEDVAFIVSIAVWGVLVLLGLFFIIITVVLIDLFLRKARNLSKQTKKLQRMLVWSLLAQVSIHGFMIALPVCVQIYDWIFIIYDNNFGMLMLFFVAYHGFFSTCAMIIFTTQIRRKVIEFARIFFRKKPVFVVLNNQVGLSSTHMESTVNN
ncbi:hypothetical protein CAEBREN_10121 [Caenorhabditis brenneri]|uniref:Uncharacterized protein n=1 Tax=Caenorhabditis brenneri TaxID=135651 RepID=G0NL89_CAEBE|nr:hypothetical protein CAEBREN_10121 [Caenorhabditis brenneri]